MDTLEAPETETPAANSEKEGGDVVGESCHTPRQDLFETFSPSSPFHQASTDEPDKGGGKVSVCMHFFLQPLRLKMVTGPSLSSQDTGIGVIIV